MRKRFDFDNLHSMKSCIDDDWTHFTSATVSDPHEKQPQSHLPCGTESIHDFFHWIMKKEPTLQLLQVPELCYRSHLHVADHSLDTGVQQCFLD